jgi:hypothetical protein
MKKLAAISTMICFLMLLGFADSRRGIGPRPHPSDYAAYADKERFSLGVSSLTKNSVLQNFSSDLTKGFIVVEVGLFPSKEKPVEIDPKLFLLKTADGSGLVRPLDPATVAGILRRMNGDKREVDLYPTVGVGYESGGYNDPYYGGRSSGGWSTGVGVGVGIGRPGNGASPEDREVMETELSDKEIPAGAYSERVCGYLYFPIAEKNRKKGYLFEGTLNGEKLSLLLKSDK